MQFTILALFAAASLVVATPVREINAYPVVVTNLGAGTGVLEARARTKANVPAPLRVGSSDSSLTNSCNAAERQCCQSIHQHNDNGIQSVMGILGIILPASDGFVGVQCTPLSSVLGGASACNSEPVCCSGNEFNGLISLGCNPTGGDGLVSGLGLGF